MLKAAYLPVNQCWIVLFGDSVIEIGDSQKRFFGTLSELDCYLKDCDLVRDPKTCEITTK